MKIYIGKYKIEIIKVKTVKADKRFLFLKYSRHKLGLLCRECKNQRRGYNYCRHGMKQNMERHCYLFVRIQK